MVDLSAFDAVLVGSLSPTYRALILEAGQQAIDQIAGETYDGSSDAVTEYMDTRPGLISTSINAETDKQLRATLTEGINAGEGIPQLADRIASVFGALAGYRAERIARTESTSAMTFASIDAWDQSGQVESVEWYTAEDEAVCAFCDEMDGTTIDIGTNFYNQGDSIDITNDNGDTSTLNLDYTDIEGPPLHAQCRCTLLPILS